MRQYVSPFLADRLQDDRPHLDECGAALEDVCKITIYLVDPRYREPVYRVVGRWLKGVYPVSTGIVVSALARPEWLVEIDVLAVTGGDTPDPVLL